MKEGNNEENIEEIGNIMIDNERDSSNFSKNAINRQDSRQTVFSNYLGKFFEKDEDESEEKDVKKIVKKHKTINISSINPLRDMRKLTRSNIQFKQKAIMELIVDLKGQYILFNIRDFIRNYQIHANPNISSIKYSVTKFIRNFLLFVYGIIIFFEKPWFCYESATIPLPDYFIFSRDCDHSVAFVGLPFIKNSLLRIIEISITITFIITQLFKFRNEFFLKNTNTGLNKGYYTVQIMLFACLFLCLIDLIVALMTGKFPVINFILRAFIYVYMIRRVRNNWVRIGKVLWNTKTVFLFMVVNIFLFSMIGFFLFGNKNSQFFNGFIETVLQLYILLSTCNFPDIMFDTFEISKLSTFYFIIYVFINYFIILSYLKTLYYTKYYKVNKEECMNIIQSIIENKFNKDIFHVKQFKRFILDQKYSYSLTDEEYKNVLILLNLYHKNNDLFTELTRIVDQSTDSIMISKTLYGEMILRSKKYEIVINVVCLLSLTIQIYNNIIFLIIQFVFSFLFLFELYPFIKNLGIKKFCTRHFNRFIFHIFNIVLMVCLVYVIVLVAKNGEKLTNDNEVFRQLKILISLRTIRIFVFLDKFRVIKNIYTIIRNSKEMFLINLFTLYSLFLLFSTFSILLTGGNIEKNSFINDQSIPAEYVYINFNEYTSSFIACFCLLMINNLNILVKSLTYHIDTDFIIGFQFYFATFYFFSTLILINILQTLLLELYLNSNFTITDKDKKKQEDKLEEEDEDDSDDDDENKEMKAKRI